MKSNNYFANEKINKTHHSADRSNLSGILFALCFSFCGMIAASEIRATTINVDCTDETATAACTKVANICSLRGALAYADAKNGKTIIRQTLINRLTGLNFIAQ